MICDLGRSPRIENGNLLQYSCLENYMDSPWGHKEWDTTELDWTYIHTHHARWNWYQQVKDLWASDLSLPGSLCIKIGNKICYLSIIILLTFLSYPLDTGLTIGERKIKLALLSWSSQCKIISKIICMYAKYFD